MAMNREFNQTVVELRNEQEVSGRAHGTKKHSNIHTEDSVAASFATDHTDHTTLRILRSYLYIYSKNNNELIIAVLLKTTTTIEVL